jgi:hypothetical protein
MINEINHIFKLPIYYNTSKVDLNDSLIKDLELTETIDISCNPIYDYVFNVDNEISRTISTQFSNTYTTDTVFLKENQKLINLMQETPELNNTKSDYTNIQTVWNNLKFDVGFREKYYYVDWDLFNFLNTSEPFLLFMSLYNLSSPVLSFLIPIIILIIPFLILKLKRLPINVIEYISVLKTVASHHSIGKLFVLNFADLSSQDLIYTIVSVIFYLFSIYQNISVFIKFINNMKTIHSNFHEITLFLNKSISSMTKYINNTKTLQTEAHLKFSQITSSHLNVLREINTKLTSITDYTFSIHKIKEIGKILKYFYELHSNKIYDEAIIYSMGFNGYIDCINGLINNINNQQINCCHFIKHTKNIKLTQNYYACLKNETPVKNNIKLNKNIIITGPNASGKTTILKSVLINIILSQQMGCGFYKTAKIAPFNKFHCYLNIPDTSGRDSLFQAEARRCKNILNDINKNIDENHLCLFDELYSGTNPLEAESTTIEFIKYLIKNNKVTSLLTTHFINVCKELATHPNIYNGCMSVNIINDNINYTFKLKEGISEIKGALNILKQFDYPEEIINKLTEIKTINYKKL